MSTYSALLEKMSSPKSCVSVWKQRYVDRSHVPQLSPIETTTVAVPSTTQKACVEPWEMPCGRPTTVDFVFPSSMSTRPPSRQDFERQLRNTISVIDNINQTVINLHDNVVSESQFALFSQSVSQADFLCLRQARHTGGGIKLCCSYVRSFVHPFVRYRTL